MTEIKMIPVAQLQHHPDNPRKDLGDLTELADSIRAQGVLQNLTIVPAIRELTETDKERYEELYWGTPTEELRNILNSGKYPASDEFWVVIGNRRMEAARMAGLTELPCVISEMDHKTQVATMLAENMQRADLTLYEQAQGFQMMMDLGFTAKEIGEKTGFSETTVNRRLKMAELDREKFEKAVGEQITMDDLDRLGKIESVKQRNALLDKFGGNNFDWELNRALAVQKASKVRTKAHQMLQAAKIGKIKDNDRYGTKYNQLFSQSCELDKWNGKKDFIPKTDKKLFYYETETRIDFYVGNVKDKNPAQEKTEEEKAEEKEIALAWKTAQEDTEAAYWLRSFYAGGKIKVTPTNAMEMLRWALIAGMAMVFDYDTPTMTMKNDPDIPIQGYSIPENLANMREWIMSMPQSKWPKVILLMFEGDNGKTHGYVDGIKREKPRYKQNKKLDMCYEWLKAFGYRMSDVEVQLQDGTHECFKKEAE